MPDPAHNQSSWTVLSPHEAARTLTLSSDASQDDAAKMELRQLKHALRIGRLQMITDGSGKLFTGTKSACASIIARSLADCRQEAAIQAVMAAGSIAAPSAAPATLPA